MSDVPARFAAECMFNCADGPVDTRAGHGAYREVSGFEPIRKGGGGNTVKFAQRTGRYAHKLCVEKAEDESRRNPGQGSLL